MRTKAILALDLLEQELLNEKQQWSILGGGREYWNASNGVSYYRDSPNDPWTACDNLNEVTITGSSNGGSGGSYGPGGNPAGWSGGGSSGGGGGSQGGNSGGNTSSNGQGSHFQDAQDQVSFALAHGLAWKEAYGTFNIAFSGTIKTDTASILKSIFNSNPYKSFLADLSPTALKGIGILNASGRVLGVTSAATSLYNLGADILDGDGHVEMKNVADAGMSVGSLFIKSNAIGFTVSAGWLLIKEEFYE